jgi:hypothetical protein
MREVSDRMALHEGIRISELSDISSYIPDTVPATMVADYQESLSR